MSPVTKSDVARLFGRQLSLVHETAYERLRFNSDGRVAATVGTKNGPICAPLWSWSLTRDGHLIAFDEKRFLAVLWRVRDQTHMDWSGIAFDGGTVTVQTPSGARVYEVDALS